MLYLGKKVYYEEGVVKFKGFRWVFFSLCVFFSTIKTCTQEWQKIYPFQELVEAYNIYRTLIK
jgi:hypothetical protein